MGRHEYGTVSDAQAVSVPDPGVPADEQVTESDHVPAGRYASPATAELGYFAARHRDAQKHRLAEEVRVSQRLGAGAGAEDSFVQALRPLEERAARELARAVRRHELYPWLRSRGFGDTGWRIPALLARLRDPWRFPGQRCMGGSDDPGHYFRPVFEPGSRCPVEFADGGHCEYAVLEPRPGTGVASVRHWVGIPGRDLRKVKHVQASYDPYAKALLLTPDVGIVAQLIRRRQLPYYSAPATDDFLGGYVEFKSARAALDGLLVSETPDDAPPDKLRPDEVGCASDHATALAETVGDPASRTSLRPIGELTPGHLDRIARQRLAGQFLGDLLMAWKEVVPL